MFWQKIWNPELQEYAFQWYSKSAEIKSFKIDQNWLNLPPWLNNYWIAKNTKPMNSNFKESSYLKKLSK